MSRAGPARRSGDGVQRHRDLEREVEDLRAMVTGYLYATAPHLAADPATLRDGMFWIRSDTGKFCFRVGGATVRVP